MPALGAGEQMIDGIPVLAAEITRIAVPRQNIGAEVLVAIYAADRPPVHNDGRMLLDQRHGKLKVDLLMPAAALIAVPAHENHALGGRNQGRGILRIGPRPALLRKAASGLGGMPGTCLALKTGRSRVASGVPGTFRP